MAFKDRAEVYSAHINVCCIQSAEAELHTQHTQREAGVLTGRRCVCLARISETGNRWRGRGELQGEGVLCFGGRGGGASPGGGFSAPNICICM